MSETSVLRAGTAPRPRWPYVGPPQRTLLLASVAITVGAFLPWVQTSIGSFTGMGGPGTWTVFGGVIGVGASLMRSHRLVVVHAVGIALVAIALPVWQLLRLLTLVGFAGWLPGIGLLVTLAAGIVVARVAAQLLGLVAVRAGDPTPRGSTRAD